MKSEQRGGLRLAAVLRWVGVAALCLAILSPTAALAQSKKGEEPTPAELKGYTLPYLFTLIGFMTVVITICMTANRKWDFVKNEDED